ncbi:MAG: prolipoprotein diacylglyceryl transferase [Bacteroidetes bacterium]|nr:MAG: prolipoprotein diacylglyceryl transferase [Bacteroidota bacterium]TDI77164.1 MAG: prolipoprotein diacylglyceryl transferase [Bacteroidota bacterium]
MHFLSFTWNPAEGLDLGFFTLQFYSLMFVIAFVTGWFIIKSIYKREGESLAKLDSLFIYMVIAILVGARLGHVIFYQSELITQDPLAVLLPIETVPEFKFTGFRGLASHGAAIGVIIAMFIYNKKVLKRHILWIFDRVVIPVALGTIFVRIGNFMNSEIIGKPTNSDFGVVFKKLGEDFPRHPAQLYEAIGYVFVFLILWFVYRKTEKRMQLGYLFGLFLVLLWSVRFIVEFFKKSQGGFEDILGDTLSTGQWLSIPFIVAGVYFMMRSTKNKITQHA